MLDDTLLDDPAALQRADHDRALLALAGAGARVRTALRQAETAGLDRLRPDGRPRAVLVAGHGSALTAAEMLSALAGTATGHPHRRAADRLRRAGGGALARSA
ncbi:mannose-6-phosphate isomerase, partial [Kitasatospora sp. NPDC036755]